MAFLLTQCSNGAPNIRVLFPSLFPVSIAVLKITSDSLSSLQAISMTALTSIAQASPMLSNLGSCVAPTQGSTWIGD